MSPARRSVKKRDWPRGLYEPRPGYFIWRHPDGRTFPIGRVTLSMARNEALAANQHLEEQRPSLVEQINGGTHSIAELVEAMPAASSKNTAKSRRALDKIIADALGKRSCGSLTVADCADLIQAEIDEGHGRQAQALRSRLIALCAKGVAKGWMESSPASVTEKVKVEVQRGRLTLASFNAILAKAAEAAEWLPQAMRLALLTGADRSTIAAVQRSDVADGYLTITRIKTGVRVAIPLALSMDCVGLSVADVAAHRTTVDSPYLVHHVIPWGNAPPGSPVFVDGISKAFTRARELAGIPDEGAPTFHEIRSLTKRLYNAQGGVDTKALLGHSTERMSSLYADPRGAEPIFVSITK